MKYILQETTLEEFQAVFKKAVNEAYQSGRESIAQESLLDANEVGDTVRYLGGDEKYLYLTEGASYKVWEKETHPQEGIPVLRIEDNRRSVDCCSLIRPDTAHLFEVIIENEIRLQDGPQQEPAPIKSPNQQRAKTIQSSKDFYAANSGDSFFWKHDKEKREVSVCKITALEGHKEVTEVTVGCKEGIVFNLDIYKAVAMAAVLEIEIPEEFLNAVQPTEIVVGHAIYGLDVNGDRFDYEKVTRVSDGKAYNEKSYFTRLNAAEYHGRLATNPIITDDTNAVYGEVE